MKNILVHDKNGNVTLSAVEMLMKTIFLRYSTALRLTSQVKFIFCHVLNLNISKIILTFAGVLFLTSCQINAQNSTHLPAHYAPLNPTRPDILDLEVPEGTLSIKSRAFIHNKTEKKSIPIELLITNLNNAGMITYVSKKNLAESGIYEIEKRP